MQLTDLMSVVGKLVLVISIDEKLLTSTVHSSCNCFLHMYYLETHGR